MDIKETSYSYNIVAQSVFFFSRKDYLFTTLLHNPYSFFSRKDCLFINLILISAPGTEDRLENGI